MADRIVLNTISYHGHGAIENIVPELTARGYKKAFVCSDPDLIKFGVTKKVTDLLDAANFAYAVYSEIKPNPTIANVQDGVAAFKAAEADCIVTIGGGSSMDTAKAIGIIINNPEFADVRSLEGVAPTRKHAVFTIAVIIALATNFISNPLGRWSAVFVMAGGIGNCIDRILYGYVQDMFMFDFAPSFPIFNVADIFPAQS